MSTPTTPTTPAPRPVYSSIEQVARELGVTARTVRNYISRGLLPAYRIPGTRGVRLRIDEVKFELKRIPSTRARTDINTFGPKARITVTAPQPPRVEAIRRDANGEIIN